SLAEVPYRQDQSEVGTLSGRVSPRWRPYPPRYRAAFASSDLVYPLLRPPSLRSGYHRGGEHRAYPVVDGEESGSVRLESVPRWEYLGCRRPRPKKGDPTHFPFGHGLSALLAVSESRGLSDSSLAFNLPILP